MESFKSMDVTQTAIKLVSSRSTTFWIVLGIVVFFVASVCALKYYNVRKKWKKYITCGRCLSKFANRVTNIVGARALDSSLLPPPTSGNNCTYSMWLYIADWTTNYGKWKSVFCKASSFPSCSSITWDMVGDQSPGIWLGDTVNNLRVAFQTEVAIPTACIQPNVPPGDKGPDNLMACVREYSRRTDTSITMTPVLEYSEIRNVPIGEWFQITIVLRGQFIELYQNGNLHTTTNLLGTPSLNTSIGQFAFANPFSGRMAFFRYMPFAVTVSLIQEMYAYENRQSFLKDIDPMQDDL